MKEGPLYFHVCPGGRLPELGHLAPFRSVVIIEEMVTSEWRAEASEWLVRSGCHYMMAWGQDCSLWDDSVDCANMDMFAPQDIPEDRFVVTTWHDHLPLGEAFYFCKQLAIHPVVELPQVILLHIACKENEAQLIEAYANA